MTNYNISSHEARIVNGQYKHYNSNIKELIYEDEVRQMWKLCETQGERLLISLCWYTGARPAELLEVKRKDIEWGLTPRGTPYFAIKLSTKKLNQESGVFAINKRTLQMTRPMGKEANVYIESIINWCKRLLPDEGILSMAGWNTTRSINKVMHRITRRIDKDWCPYQFRHSVFTHLANNNFSVSELMAWKGSSNPASVNFYIHARPAFIAIENLRRERNQIGGVDQR